MRYLRTPADFASAGPYVAPGKPWDAGARYILPTNSQLTNGATPDSALAAEYENGRMRVLFDAEMVQAHSAIRNWTAVTIPQVGTDGYTDVVGQRLSRGYGVNTDTQRQIYCIGLDAATGPNQVRVAQSSDGSQFDPATLRLNTIAAFTAPTYGFPGAANEIMLANQTTKFAYSSNNAVTWALSAVVAANVLKLHYVPGAGAAAGYYAFNVGATNNCGRAATLALLDSAPSLSTVGGAPSFSSGNTLTIADNGTVIMVSNVIAGAAKIYRSINGGATWTLSLTYNAAAVNTAVVYSDYWGLFIALDDFGELHTSNDGTSWATVRTGLTSANGFSVSGGSLVACGAAIATQAVTVNGSAGIAYSFDLGTTWNFHYLGYGSLAPTVLRTFNGRIFALGGKTIWRSGFLGAAAAEL